jgi:hypothetical protein
MVMVAALLVGIAVRLLHFVRGRPLWMDEALLALNVATRPVGELVPPLDYAQSAPLLFVWLQRMAVVLGGVNEWALRAVPLLAGIGALFLLRSVGRRLLGSPATTLLVAAAALSPLLVLYATEAKAFGSDAFVTTALLAAALGLLAYPERDSRWAVLAVMGAAAMWLSSPAVFVLAGCGLALLLDPRVRAVRGWFLRLAGCGAVWLASFVGAYLVVLRGTVGDASLQRFFRPTYLIDEPPGLLARGATAVGAMLSSTFLQRDLFDVLGNAARLAWVGAVGALCVFGLVHLVRRHGGAVAALLLTPIGAAFAASALERYSLTARLMTYAAPILLLLLAAGVEAIVSGVIARSGVGVQEGGRSRGVITVALGAVLLLPAAYHHIEYLDRPLRDGDPRSVARLVLARVPREVPLYVPAGSYPLWVFYSTNWSAPDAARLSRAAGLAESPDGPAYHLRLRGGRPVEREGDTLQTQWGGRLELVGVSSGLDWDATGPRRPVAPGWAANEVRRMVDVARPCVALVLIREVRAERRALYSEIDRRGGTATVIVQTRDGHAVQACFPGSGTPPGASS